MEVESLLANHWDGLVRRKVVTVILKHKEIKNRDQSVGGIASDEIDLLVFKRAIQQAKIHDARWFGEAQAIRGGQAFVAVGPLHELVAEARAPLRSIGGGLRNCFEAETPCVFATDFDGKSIVEAQRRNQREAEALLVFGFHPSVNVLRRACRFFLEDRSEGCAGVLRAGIDAPR